MEIKTHITREKDRLKRKRNEINEEKMNKMQQTKMTRYLRGDVTQQPTISKKRIPLI